MLGYFPRTYEDELIYSIIARYQRDSGSPTRHVNLALFGRANRSGTYDFLVGLPKIAEAASSPRITAEELLESHTLFPYYRSVMTEERAQHAKAAILRSDEIGSSFSNTLQIVPKPKRLRFCSACLEESIKVNGEGYWRRDHQIGGVLVCLRHGRFLQQSTVGFGKGSDRYYPAGRDTCPVDSPAVLRDTNPDILADMIEMSKILVNAMNANMSMLPELAVWIENFQHTCERQGVNIKLPFYMTNIRRKFFSRFGYLRDIWPNLFRTDTKNDWIKRTMKPSIRENYHLHPLTCFLLGETIKGITAPEPEPFGSGPWECINPYASHFGSEVVMRADIVRTADSTYRGRFLCDCGAVYLKWTGDGVPSKSTKILAYGALATDFLIWAIAENFSFDDIVENSAWNMSTLYKKKKSFGSITTVRKDTMQRSCAASQMMAKFRLTPIAKSFYPAMYKHDRKTKIRSGRTLIDLAKS